MKRILMVAALVLLGCDDNDNNKSSNNEINNSTNNVTNNSTNTLCQEIPEIESFSRVAIISTDYENGSIGILDMADENYEILNDQLPVHSDALGRVYGDVLYIINRLGADNITAYDAQTLELIYQVSTGQQSNPQDFVLIDSCKAYISLLGKSYISIIDPVTGEISTEVINMDDFADEDGLPEISFMEKYDDVVFVAVQNLIDYVPSRNGRIVKLNPETDEVSGIIELSGENPFTPIVKVGDTSLLAVGCAGDFSGDDSTLEVFDRSGEIVQIIGDSESIGGVITDLVFIDDYCSYCVVSTPDWQTGIKKICMENESEWIIEPGEYDIAGITVTPENNLIFGERNTPAVRLIDIQNEGTGPVMLELSLPPSFSRPFIPMD
ncbi:MAG: hypothetical protein JXR95_10115 [Deltaproteobacteria bacterium]|nr:hypothetical protein [Deltaproteobacteria bacterium]